MTDSNAPGQPPSKPAPSYFGSLDFESNISTRPMGLHELPLQAQFDAAIQLLLERHPRIAATITSIWGHDECTAYIGNLVMAGGDGAGRQRIGFSGEVTNALMCLSTLQEKHFKPENLVQLNPFTVQNKPRP